MKMKASILGASCLLFVGCSSAVIRNSKDRHPNAQTDLGEIVTSTDAGGLCDGTGPGQSCLASWQKAKAYCESHGSHLPTALEYVTYLARFGVQSLSVEEFNKADGITELQPADIKGLPRKNGFYKVACMRNPDGTDDTFYMNDYFYKRPAELQGFNRIWTATSPPGHENAAHVVYDEWGGGGGIPSEHMKSAANAFRCAPNL